MHCALLHLTIRRAEGIYKHGRVMTGRSGPHFRLLRRSGDDLNQLERPQFALKSHTLVFFNRALDSVLQLAISLRQLF